MPREHGTYACYTAKCTGCDRETQKAAKRAYDKRVRRLKAYGRWEPMVDAEPVRAHVNQLRAAGLGSHRISVLSGVPSKVIAALLYGVEGMGPSKRVRQHTAGRLLSLQASPDLLAPGALVDPTGSRRRLQALQALGWTQSGLCRALGVGRSQIGQLIGGRSTYVRADTARSISVLYDRLWNQFPPERTAVEKRNAAIARGLAGRNGWPLPMAWDDDSIDDPSAVPDGAAEPDTGRRLPEGQELLWLVDELGETHEALAQRFTVHIKTVKTAIARARSRAARQDMEVAA